VLELGAAYHMTFELDMSANLFKLDEVIKILGSNGKVALAKEVRIIDLGSGVILKHMLCVPIFMCNLIHVHRSAKDENCIITYGAYFCIIQDLTSKKLIGVGEMRNGVYYLKHDAGEATFAALQNKDPTMWHQYLGHPSVGSLTALSVDSGFKPNKDCFGCYDIYHKAKQTQNTFLVSESRASRPFALMHWNLWGYYHTLSLSGYPYFLSIVGDYTRAIWLYLLQDKMEAYEKIVNFCSMVWT